MLLNPSLESKSTISSFMFEATYGPLKIIDVYNWTKFAPHLIFSYAVSLSLTPPTPIIGIEPLKFL